eukprot:Sspe_Gene.104243::Locus_80236_Transcript_1_1_Confidence_1.000_Length_1183::g.104243::m.104243
MARVSNTDVARAVVSRMDDLESGTSTTVASFPGEGEFVIRVLSDLHIGVPGDGANDFNITDKEFVGYLTKLLRKDGTDAVVLLGDILEMWEVEGLTTKPADRLKRLRDSRPMLFKFFDEHLGKDVFYVAGNHDVSTTKLMDAPLGLVVEANGQSVFFTHGHFVDEDNSGSGEWRGRLGTAFRSAMERLMHDDIDVLLMKVARQVGRSGDASIYREWGQRLCMEYSYSLAVMGHTHKLEHITADGYQYANTGNGEDFTREGKVQVTSVFLSPSGTRVTQATVQLGGASSGCCVLQ